jgi:ribosomal protein L37AE/L43A
MTSWGKCLGYTGTACPICGRYRLELYENGKRVCEKCNWCIEDGTYRDVYAEEDECMYDKYCKSYDIYKEKQK